MLRVVSAHYMCRSTTLNEIVNNHSQQNDENFETEPPIYIHEIKAALKHLKNNKAAGSDEVPGELFKYDRETKAKLMHVICSNIWRNEIPGRMDKVNHHHITKKKETQPNANWTKSGNTKK